MATTAELEQALINADRAGDKRAARILAQEINRRRSEVGMPIVEPKTAPDPTEGMSGIDKFRAGVGQGLTNRVRGIGNLLGVVPTEAVDEAQRIDAPLLRTGQGQAGSIVGGAAAAAPALAMPGANTVLGSGAVGGMLGMTEPVGSGDSRAFNTLGGAAMGAATQGIFSSMLPYKPTTPERQSFVDWTQKIGAPATIGQMSGSPMLRRIEGQLAALPGSANFYRNAREGAQKAVTTEVKDIIGGDPGQMYQEFGRGKSVKFDEKFFSDLKKIKGSFKETTAPDDPTSAYRTINEWIGRESPSQVKNPLGVIFGRNTAQVDKTTSELPMIGPKDDFNNVQALRSLYGKRAYDASDPVDKAAYRKLRDAFDDLVERNFPGQGYDKIRKSYRIERMVSKAQDTATGDYSPTKIGGILNKVEQNDPGTVAALGDEGARLQEIQRNAPFMVMPNSSGTAENLLAQKIATAGLLSGGGGLGGTGAFLLTGEPTTALTGAALGAGGAYVAPWLVNAAIQSRRGGILGGKAGESLANNPALFEGLRVGVGSLPFGWLAQ